MMNFQVNKKVSGVVKWFLPFYLFTFLPLSATAQKLAVAKPVLECGRTGFKQPVTATFELKNKGHRRLLIESVKPDCGCTDVEFPKEVGAGDKFTIKLTYDARQLGRFHKMAAIKSNGSKQPVYLTMKGIVVAELEDYTGNYAYKIEDLLLDKNELEFDDVNKGDAPVQEIHIMNDGAEAMTPTVMHLPSYLSAKIVPEKLFPGKTGTISVTLNTEKLRDYGLTQSTVYIGRQLGEKVSEDNSMGVSIVLLPDMKSFDAANKANAPKLQISTTDIDFTNFEGKSKKTAEVILENTGASVLQISSMQLFTRGLKVTLDQRAIQPGQSAKIKITGIASELTKVRTRPRILMITNDPDHAKVVINIKK